MWSGTDPAAHALLPEFPLPATAVEQLKCPVCDAKETLNLTVNVERATPADAVVGTKKLRVALFQKYTEYFDDLIPALPRIQCTECEAVWKYTGHYTAVSIQAVSAAVRQGVAGRGYSWCQCHEPALAEAGITFQATDQLPEADLSLPSFRGWFYADGRLAVLCPICDGDMVNKRSEKIAAGLSAMKDLMGTKESW